MSEISKNKAEEALRGYLEAVDNHDRLLDNYFPTRPVVPGQPIIFGEPVTEKALEELKEAETKIAVALKKWNISLGL